MNQPSASGNGTQFEIVQTGDLVTIPLAAFDPMFGSETIDATIAGATLAVSSSALAAQVIAGERVIDGEFQKLVYPTLCKARMLASRCECFDGNTTGGDGCDANCRVEPCFHCEGDPSICAPLEDGAAYNDHHDCTAGETCSAGVCGAGTDITVAAARGFLQRHGGSGLHLRRQLEPAVPDLLDYGR